jgi:hypothetical protein
MATEGGPGGNFPLYAYVTTGAGIEGILGLAATVLALSAVAPVTGGLRWTFRGRSITALAAVLVVLHVAVAWTLGGVIATGRPVADTASALGLSLLVPGVPLFLLGRPALRRLWTPPRAPAVNRAGSRQYSPPQRPTGPAPAPLQPFPRPGSRPVAGQVWLVYFPYEDQPGGKRRPALILGAGGQGITVLKITSQDKSVKQRYFTPIDNSGWHGIATAGKQSWLEFGKPVTLPYANVVRPLGLCSPQRLWDLLAAHYQVQHAGWSAAS